MRIHWEEYWTTWPIQYMYKPFTVLLAGLGQACICENPLDATQDGKKQLQPESTVGER